MIVKSSLTSRASIVLTSSSICLAWFLEAVDWSLRLRESIAAVWVAADADFSLAFCVSALRVSSSLSPEAQYVSDPERERSRAGLYVCSCITNSRNRTMVCSKSWQESSKDSTFASSSRMWVSFDSEGCGQYDTSTFHDHCTHRFPRVGIAPSQRDFPRVRH